MRRSRCQAHALMVHFRTRGKSMVTRRAALMFSASILIPMHAASADLLTRSERADGKVTACSKYGQHTCETATLVPSPFGMKMRLKGGTLIDCEADCRETLRKATVDFWHDQRDRNR